LVIAILGLLALSNCAAAEFNAMMPTDEQRAGLQYRQLSATEKESLRRSLEQRWLTCGARVNQPFGVVL
jgi:hypothetical protein